MIRREGPFFRSRWIEVAPHVRELPEGGLPAGFRAAAAAAGVKPTADPVFDVGLLVSDEPATTSAVRFTASGVLAAPVLVTRDDCQVDALRAVAANSGNANAATGEAGLEAARRMQRDAAVLAGVDAERVAVASTGVIGVELDAGVVAAGLDAAARELRRDGDADFAAAIMTTDAFEKRATLAVELPGGVVMLAAQAKGAGMISPNFATMLCFVETDAALSAETADLLLGVTVKRSFDRISVDGQLSTNDTVVLLCSGASGVEVAPESEAELRFGEALDALLRQLALDIVVDGEGARRVGRVVVRGGAAEPVDAVARAIANSPLVKTALYGADPNWGRIAQAIGAALPGSDPLDFDIAIEGTTVCEGGLGVAADIAALEQAVSREEVEYVVDLPGDGFETEVFFSDLGYDYVRINAEYTT
ncbi:MAG TPA: bifunctional glutamate N-acetyltransferase/amino-acid acetyltransferase ArgJ [Solirubrobacteraceae bacterium]|nr:bifunctional glutamate N-acetyltransferase/amino-acid acetyltransferase ArgJ [Solirubrobacteraceae bacterium]